MPPQLAVSRSALPHATQSASLRDARNELAPTVRLALNAKQRATFKHAGALITNNAWARFSREWIASVTRSTARRVDCWFSAVESEKQPLPAWALLAVDDELFEAWVRAARAHRQALKGDAK